MRGTSRREEGLAAIEAAGIEPALADPERPGTVLELVGDVAVVYWLLGSAEGERGGARGDPRRRGSSGCWNSLVETPVRGFVYEAAGSGRAASCWRRRELVETAARTWRIPVAVAIRTPDRLADRRVDEAPASQAGQSK